MHKSGMERRERTECKGSEDTELELRKERIYENKHEGCPGTGGAAKKRQGCTIHSSTCGSIGSCTWSFCCRRLP